MSTNKKLAEAEAKPENIASNEPFLYAHTTAGKLDLYEKHRRWIGLHSSWSRIGENDTEISKRTSSSSSGASLAVSKAEETRRVRALIAQLCEALYQEKWATGTAGGFSIRVGGGDQPWRVFVTPSGLQKEDLIGDDMFELDMEQNVVQGPLSNPKLKLSACTSLWYIVYKYRPKATAVLHTHSPNAVYATLLDPTEKSKTFTMTHMEMLKGVGNHAYDDTLEIPIIDNRPTEDLLGPQFEVAIQQFPKANAILVRRHGLFVWGDSWEQCKTQTESLDYLLGLAVQMKQLGIDYTKRPPNGTFHDDEDDDEDEELRRNAQNNHEYDSSSSSPPPKKHKQTSADFHGLAAVDNVADCLSNPAPLLPRDRQYKALLLDIEGCTTSIAFVKDVLFPFARAHLQEFLHTLSETETLRKSLQEEAEQAGLMIPDDKDTDITTLVHTLMDHDIKSATLKDIQGKIWKQGYEAGLLQGHVYTDFFPALQWLFAHDFPVYIYSSGSIAAQKLIFGHSTAGDLLPFIEGHFDIPTAGPKKEMASYTKIAAALNLEPSSIIFCSDMIAELEAAEAAGMCCVLTIRPGNAPLPRDPHYPTIHSLLQLCCKE